ncbi:MAG: GntR family transcriptional regulator [Desulfobacterium sp.]
MNKKDLPNEIYSLLRSRILGFKILPGVKISDKDIAKELGVSRTPVREALIRLTGHGLVQSLHNKGFTVREFSAKDVQDIYILREALELLALKLTIQGLNDEKIQAFKTLLGGYPALIASRNRNEFNKADENFHKLIAEFSENLPLKMQMNSLQDQLAILRRYAHLLSEDWRETYEEETYQQHQTIFEHIINNELTKAKQAMSRHIKASMNSVVAVLKENLD